MPRGREKLGSDSTTKMAATCASSNAAHFHQLRKRRLNFIEVLPVYPLEAPLLSDSSVLNQMPTRHELAQTDMNREVPSEINTDLELTNCSDDEEEVRGLEELLRENSKPRRDK